MTVRRLLLFLLLGASPARAHSVSNEVALGLNDSSPASAQAANVADQLTFRFDLNEDWTLKVGAAYTYDPSSPPMEGAVFGTSSAQIFSAVGGVDWDVSSRVNVYLDVSGSPVAGQKFGSVFGTSTISATEVLLDNLTSSVGALAGASFTLGGTEFLGTVLGGTVLDLSLGWTLLTTQQRVDAVVDGQGRPVSRSDAPGDLPRRPQQPGLQGDPSVPPGRAGDPEPVLGDRGGAPLALPLVGRRPVGERLRLRQGPHHRAAVHRPCRDRGVRLARFRIPARAAALGHQPELPATARGLQHLALVRVPGLRLGPRAGQCRRAQGLPPHRTGLDGVGRPGASSGTRW